MDKKYAIGVDYGTQSGRAILVDVSDGTVLAQSTKTYTHGVMEEYLPDGTRLLPDWALEHPWDYVEVLEITIPDVMKKSGVRPEDVIGMSIDFTACTMMPVDREGRPLCLMEEWRQEPHAWLKLWKHHAAQEDANRCTNLARARGEAFLKRYGGRVSSEWMIPKLMEILREAPKVYEAADAFVEAADWVVFKLTGNRTRSSCCAGYKAFWNKKEGYPSKDFYRELDARLEHVTEDKLRGTVYSQGEKAGELTEEMAEKLGLMPGMAVGTANVDAHVSLPAVGITKPNQLLMIMGTSTCGIMCSQEEKMVPGICGVVEDGVLPGLYGYEAGQPCVGDHFEWFVKNCVPGSYYAEAEERQMDIHQLLTEKASHLKIGESGLLALDWWNGNRSVLVDAGLTGMILGLTLTTRPEEIYRALIEATAFGMRTIIENFEQAGVPVEELYACGGISKKNAMMMQIYADVTNREIFIGASDQCPALGSAMFGAVAAGSARGGYDTIFQAAEAMGHVEEKSYRPVPEHARAYERLYEEFKILHDYFGRGSNDVMKRLKKIKTEVRR